MDDKNREETPEEKTEKKSFWVKFLPSKKEGSLLNTLFRKENMVTLIAIGVLLLIILIPFDKKKKESGVSVFYPQSNSSNEEQSQIQNTEERILEEQLEKRLEEMLSKMEGVGRTEVMISYSRTKEKQKQNNSASIFGTVTETSGENTEKHVEGVLVLCEGGDKSDIVFLVSETIQALFPLEAHKIKVTKLSHSS